MGLVPVQPDFVAGTPIVASEVNSKFDAIIEVVNGGIDNANVRQLSADKITSGVFHQDRIPRLRLDQLPQNDGPLGGFRVLSVTQPGSDPQYRRITWNDVEGTPGAPTVGPTWNEVRNKPATATRWPTWSEVSSKPSTFPPSSHTHPWGAITGKPSSFPPSSHSASLLTSGTVPRARLPIGATNNTQIAPGQAMTGSGNAQHPVGSVRLLVHTSETANVTAGDTISGSSLRVAGSWTILWSGSDTPISGFSPATQTALPGTWQALSTAGYMPVLARNDHRNPFLAVRVS